MAEGGATARGGALLDAAEEGGGSLRTAVRGFGLQKLLLYEKARIFVRRLASGRDPCLEVCTAATASSSSAGLCPRGVGSASRLP